MTDEEWAKEEKLQNEIIHQLRMFSEGDCHHQTTGSQRYWAKDIIRTIRDHDKKEETPILGDKKRL